MDGGCARSDEMARSEKPRNVGVSVRMRPGGDVLRHQHTQRAGPGASAHDVLEVRRMTVTIRREPPLWCIYTADGLYLCGYFCRTAAEAKCEAEGWRIV
jgi:hypothetical protein